MPALEEQPMSFRCLALVLGLVLAWMPHGAAVAGHQSHSGHSHDRAAQDRGEHSSRQDDRYWVSRTKAVRDLLASREGQATSVESRFHPFLTQDGSSWVGQPTRPGTVRVTAGDVNGDGYEPVVTAQQPQDFHTIMNEILVEPNRGTIAQPPPTVPSGSLY